MQSNPSFLSDHDLIKQKNFLNLCVQTFCLLKHKGTFLYKFHFIKNQNATWVRIASFWKEAVLCILRLMTTHTLCKLGHCSSVAVTSLSGVKSEPTVACLANPPFLAISTFSSPKWGPPRAMNHQVYLSTCPLTLNNIIIRWDLHCKSSRGISFHMET